MRKFVSSAFRPFIKCFLAGLLAILPLVLTIAIVAWVAGFIRGYVGPDSVVGRMLESLGLKFAQGHLLPYAVGWAFVLGVIFLLGLFVEMGAKRWLRRLVDGVVRHIPLIGSVYGTSTQLVDMFDHKSEAEMKAMSVVFCTFGENGAGVLALMPSPERFRIDGRDYHVVIIPTAPVPFGGGLLFMPVDSVKPSEMSVDGLMSIYVSMGVTTREFIRDPAVPAG